ncbi:MAG: hypothetical protein QW175_07570, partial [Candidatus Bathyarchaeia archaeon]
SNITTEEIFRWKAKNDEFEYLGHSSLLEEHMKKLDLSKEDVRQELQRRKTVLEWMVRKGIRRYTEVANVIREYYANPTRVFQRARMELK